jgi:hypothetical protein
MSPNEDLGLERELSAAMADEVAHLSAPRPNLGAIRRRVAVRRRLLVPVTVGLVTMVIGGPLALAKTGVFESEPAGAEGAGAAKVEASLPKQVGDVVREDPAGSPAGQTADQGDQPSSQAGGQAPATSCLTSTGALPAEVRAVLLDDAIAVVNNAQRDVAGALGTVERLTVDTATVDRLLPAVGSVVALVNCGDVVSLAPQLRDTVLGQVRGVVHAAALVAGGVVTQTVGQLDVSAVTPVAVAVVSRTESSALVHVSLGGGAVPHLGSLTVTVRLADGVVTKVDLSTLDLNALQGLVGGGLASLPGTLAGLLGGGPLDLLGGLNALDVAGVQQLVPNVSSVLADDVKIVQPVLG